ncbi:MAG: sulfite exporter TauE/SafE family protein [Spirochaetales bacterium]|nr:sulfite exporter TauE/SafE family protein [Spirochaetales bacterium]
MDLALYSFAFLQGLGGSLHCAGMCGPFACLAGQDASRPWYTQTLYNSARSISYISMGALLGLSGNLFNRTFFSSLAAIIGAVMLTALILLLLRRRLSYRWTGRLLRLLPSANLRAITFGLVAAFLPCGLLLSAYALAMSTGEFSRGALVMASFSVATWPVLFFVAYSSHRIPANWRRLQPLLSGVFLISGLSVLLYRAFFLPDPFCQ